jgi:hypothetical protein
MGKLEHFEDVDERVKKDKHNLDDGTLQRSPSNKTVRSQRLNIKKRVFNLPV